MELKGKDKAIAIWHETEKLCSVDPDHANLVRGKHQEIVSNWEKLKACYPNT